MTILRYGGILVFTSKWWAYQNTKALLAKVKIMDFAVIFTSVCMRDRNLKSFIVFGKALASWSESYPVCRSNTSYDGKHEMGFLAAGNCQSHLFCTTASHKLSHLVENCSNLAKRKLERGKEGGGGREGGEDEQRLPRRAWSCNCEKRLLHYLHRTP